MPMRLSLASGVILIDDLIATGGTAEGAVTKLLRQIGAEAVAACFIVDLPDLRRRCQVAGDECAGRT